MPIKLPIAPMTPALALLCEEGEAPTGLALAFSEGKARSGVDFWIASLVLAISGDLVTVSMVAGTTADVERRRMLKIIMETPIG